jgi:1-acyl-sn-glycerol-3-phosphate acyltransferase
MTTPAPPPQSRKDRFIRTLAYRLVWLLYRDVDVYFAPGQVTEGAEVTVSNHFGGFADPLLLMSVLPRRPRIIARDKIFKIPVVGWIMRWLGGIPVHRAVDKGRSGNDQMFASCYKALHDGNEIMIFPEGVTRDDPSIAPVKTGAARIAMGARSDGVADVKLTPAGIHYENKAALRSRVSIHVGTPLDLDTELSRIVEPGEPEDTSNHDAVRALTADIEQQLRRVAPDFEDWTEARALTFGAEVLLRTVQDDPGAPVPISERDRVAALLGRRPAAARAEVVAAVGQYESDLEAVGLSDADLYQNFSAGRFLWHVVWNVLVALLLLPFAIVGIAVNWIPMVLLWLLGRLRVAPAVKATILPMGAILLYAITWGITAWGANELLGLEGVGGVLLLMPIYLFAVIVLSERLVLIWKSVRTWIRQDRAGSLKERIMADRRQVVDTVTDAL